MCGTQSLCGKDEEFLVSSAVRIITSRFERVNISFLVMLPDDVFTLLHAYLIRADTFDLSQTQYEWC